MTAERPLQGKRILILEDDFYLATDEKALLEGAGADVVGPFGSSCSERDILEAGPIDGAIVDINLGEGPTFDFAQTLESQGIPFVFVTGYDAAVISDDLSHVPRIEKPIRDQDLVTAVRALVGG